MLTRIRIEAEGPTVQAVQEDVFSVYDGLVALIWGRHVVAPCKLVDEVITQAAPPEGWGARWYRGRAIMLVNSDHVDSFQVRGRTSWLAQMDESFDQLPPPPNPSSVPGVVWKDSQHVDAKLVVTHGDTPSIIEPSSEVR